LTFLARQQSDMLGFRTTAAVPNCVSAMSMPPATSASVLAVRSSWLHTYANDRLKRDLPPHPQGRSSSTDTFSYIRLHTYARMIVLDADHRHGVSSSGGGGDGGAAAAAAEATAAAAQAAQGAGHGGGGDSGVRGGAHWCACAGCIGVAARD
jgi:hypothetical protein